MAIIKEKFLQLLNKSGTQVKPRTWKDKDGTPNLVNQRIFAHYLREKLGYRKMEDWYDITTKLIRDNGGGGLLAGFYSDSASKFVMAMIPDYNWLIWKFMAAPKGIWDDVRAHKKYGIWLEEQLGYKTNEDWYKITQKIINKNYGRGLLLHKYDGSPSKFVMAVFPDYNLVEWKFGHARYIWQDENNHKRYAGWLKEELGYTKMEDWYKLTSVHIRDNYGGGGLLRYYNSSPSKFIMAMFPKYKWLEWKFTQVPKGFWQDENNRKRYAEWLKEELGYKTMEDWYKLTSAHMRDNYGGGGLMNYYKHSPSKFVMDMFDYEWVEWKFCLCPQGYWKDKGNRKKYAIWLGKQLGYKTMEDWYKISRLLIKENYGGGMLMVSYGDTASKFVMDVFPEYNWDISKFKKNYSQGQIQYMEFLKVSTPDIRHILNHPDGEFPIPGSLTFTGGHGHGYLADGYSAREQMIYEFLGDKCHGNPAIYKAGDWCKWLKTTFGELYNKEVKRRKFCEDSGFGYHSIWESEWHRGIQAIRRLQRKFKN